MTSPPLGRFHQTSGPSTAAQADQPVFTAFTQEQSASEHEPTAPPHSSIPRLETYNFHSAILPDDRVISVYLPREYGAEGDRRFPVFYLHDGQNLFDPQTSYIPGRTWRAGETADRMSEEGLAAPIILVGISNTGLRRMAEYTPTRDFRMGGGEGRSYARLLIEELKPFIDRRYRTLPAAADTGLGGSSLGGLITLFLGFEHPEIFSRLAILSPSLWWNQRSILHFVEHNRPRPRPRIWLDIGSAEGALHVRDTERLNRILLAKGWKQGVDLRLLVVAGAVHDEDAWATRFDQVLRFLFPMVHSTELGSAND
jgi:predicted alpha/beta superfamily hydrolase